MLVSGPALTAGVGWGAVEAGQSPPVSSLVRSVGKANVASWQTRVAVAAQARRRFGVAHTLL